MKPILASVFPFVKGTQIEEYHIENIKVSKHLRKMQLIVEEDLSQGQRDWAEKFLKDSLRLFSVSVISKSEIIEEEIVEDSDEAGTDEKKKPAVAVHRHDNAFYFSVYNRDTTSESRFSFPLGAPILNGCDALIENDSASYCFPRGAHHECRAFVKQKSGTVRAREMAPVSAKYRRKLLISGLEDAVISLFPSSDCLDTAAVGSMRGDSAVELLQGFSTVSDENGTYLSKEHVSGSVCLLFPY